MFQFGIRNLSRRQRGAENDENLASLDFFHFLTSLPYLPFTSKPLLIILDSIFKILVVFFSWTSAGDFRTELGEESSFDILYLILGGCGHRER